MHPIAGTRPRGGDHEADKDIENELLADEKEKSEHLMLVDLGRNDLSRVSAPGTVEVSQFMKVERYSHVMHLVSTLEAQVADGVDAVSAVMATFPAGTLSGAPKVRAIEIIDELEPVGRGVYGGAVGYFDFAGNADMAIAIRTAVAFSDRVLVQAGAGVVVGSVPEKEDEECRAKAQVVIDAIHRARAGLN
jgi:anthranilate synthase component 1